MDAQDVITYKQDVVTYNQAVIRILTEEEVQHLNDENLLLVLKFLREGPKTVKELVKNFISKGITKSDKSIYRYLKELIKVKLVAKAGKRITSINEDALHSETIYIRTAKIFLKDTLKAKHEKLGKKNSQLFTDIIKSLLKQKFRSIIKSDEDLKSDENLEELIAKFDLEKNKLIVELFENADEETLKKISELDWGLIDSLIEYVGWLALSLDMNISKEIEKCCEK